MSLNSDSGDCFVGRLVFTFSSFPPTIFLLVALPTHPFLYTISGGSVSAIDRREINKEVQDSCIVAQIHELCDFG